MNGTAVFNLSGKQIRKLVLKSGIKFNHGSIKNKSEYSIYTDTNGASISEVNKIGVATKGKSIRCINLPFLAIREKLLLKEIVKDSQFWTAGLVWTMEDVQKDCESEIVRLNSNLISSVDLQLKGLYAIKKLNLIPEVEELVIIKKAIDYNFGTDASDLPKYDFVLLTKDEYENSEPSWQYKKYWKIHWQGKGAIYFRDPKDSVYFTSKRKAISKEVIDFCDSLSGDIQVV